MSYTINASALIESVSSLNNNKSVFKLPLVELGSTLSRVYPQSITTIINVEGTETINLAALGITSVKLIAVRSTRPVNLTFSIGVETFTTPFTTFFMHLLDTKEVFSNNITSIVIAVPDIGVTAPNPLPPSYPKAEIELFIVAVDSD